MSLVGASTGSSRPGFETVEVKTDTLAQLLGLPRGAEIWSIGSLGTSNGMRKGTLTSLYFHWKPSDTEARKALVQRVVELEAEVARLKARL